MVFERCALNKTLAARVALIGTLARVPPYVQRQVIRLGEALITISTLVGAFAIVDAHVLLQLVGAREALLTNGADMRPLPRMGASMALQIGRPWKRHVAVVALERLLAGMPSYVYDQIG